MGKFFTVDVSPDIVAGDISTIQAANKAHVDLDANDIIFDWTAVDVPKGGCMLRSITAIVNAEDGAYGSGSLTSYHLIFAKSVNGVAPTTMGVTNAAQTACFDLKDHYVGSVVLEATAETGTILGTAFHVAYHSSDNSATGGGLPMVVDLDHTSGTNVGYDKLYVMGFQMDARGYQTGVIVNGAITSDTETDITVDGVAATKIFSVGDTVYLHDVDTALGTVKSLTDTVITLNAAIAGGTDLADDDELVNANPIKLKLGFER
jgi:hypothetical protein